jgi:hypothetical protein
MDAGPHGATRGTVTMTFFELSLLLTSAGVSAAGCAAVCSAVLDRIAREPGEQRVPATPATRQQPQQQLH